jgi:branched-chain amino acid transport system ATP-binding protein
MSNLLSIQNLTVAYGGHGAVLQDVNLDVPLGGRVALLGANGAGKTTLIRAVTGLLDHHQGAITQGRIDFADTDVSAWPSHRRVRFGMGQVPEGRMVFKQLSVEDNLLVGAANLNRQQKRDGLESIFKLFPKLKERCKQEAGWLSGGEQQMVAMGRALIANPRLLLVDELSLGLAPLVVHSIYRQLQQVSETLGTSILVVEQNATLALEFAQTAYVLERGKVILTGPASDVAASDTVREAYLGRDDAQAYRFDVSEEVVSP